MFDPDEPRNSELILAVGRDGNFPPCEKIDLGTHFDLIDHFWDLGFEVLKEDTSWIVACRPALVHPKTGVAFAIAMGTSYYIRLPEGPDRARYDAELLVKLIAQGNELGGWIIGPSWVSGWYLTNESDYIRRAYEQCG